MRKPIAAVCGILMILGFLVSIIGYSIENEILGKWSLVSSFISYLFGLLFLQCKNCNSRIFAYFPLYLPLLIMAGPSGMPPVSYDKCPNCKKRWL